MSECIDKAALVAELNRLIAELVKEGKNTMFEQGRISAFEDVKVFINHILEVKEVKEEPVSDDLEEAARRIATRHSHITGDTYYANDAWFFKKGAQWQKEHLWKPADGDDLPDIDREVIVLYQPYPCEGNEYAVSFAHRPPERWYGRNLDGEEHVFEPKTYDKGGWNIPDVKWWLDLELPIYRKGE